MGKFTTTTTLDILMVDTTFDSITTQLAGTVITNAENKIRERLSERYDVSAAAFQTSTATPPVVQTLAQWLSQGYLYENLSRGGKMAFERADRFIDKAMKNIDEILDFKANISDSTGADLADKALTFQVLSNTKDYHDTFNEDPPTQWNVDENKLDDIRDERDT
jgi:hypothetical protein